MKKLKYILISIGAIAIITLALGIQNAYDRAHYIGPENDQATQMLRQQFGTSTPNQIVEELTQQVVRLDALFASCKGNVRWSPWAPGCENKTCQILTCSQ